MRLAIGVLLFVDAAFASFCGNSAVPYSLEVRPNGQLVLGCARASCFGFLPSGKPLLDRNQQFLLYSDGNTDGFVRAGNDYVQGYGEEDVRYHTPQNALCEESFSSVSCARSDLWVGGIDWSPNNGSAPLRLRCCSWYSLTDSSDQGIARVHPGQMVRGGEVFTHNDQTHFDYIGNIVRQFGRDGSIWYDVSVRRMQCDSNGRKQGKSEFAFQQPIAQAETPIALNGGGPQGPADGAAQTGVLEETFVEEGVQLQPGATVNTQPFGPVPPAGQFPQAGAGPVFQQPPVFQAPVFQQPIAGGGGPVYSGGGGGGFFCFSADQIVETMTGEKRMDELEKNDWVKSVQDGQVVFQPVNFWLHRVPDENATFHEIETSDGKAIKLTDKHYIFKGDCSNVERASVPFRSVSSNLVMAEEIETGNCLYTLHNGNQLREVKVTGVSKVREIGIYAPMTENGGIIVNGVYASCYNNVESDVMHQTVFGLTQDLQRLSSWMFDADQEIVNTPPTLAMFVDLFDHVVPKSALTF